MKYSKTGEITLQEAIYALNKLLQTSHNKLKSNLQTTKNSDHPPPHPRSPKNKVLKNWPNNFMKSYKL